MEPGLQTPRPARRLIIASSASLAGLLFVAAGIVTIIAAELRWGAACFLTAGRVTGDTERW